MSSRRAKKKTPPQCNQTPKKKKKKKKRHSLKLTRVLRGLADVADGLPGHVVRYDVREPLLGASDGLPAEGVVIASL